MDIILKSFIMILRPKTCDGTYVNITCNDKSAVFDLSQIGKDMRRNVV